MKGKRGVVFAQFLLLFDTKSATFTRVGRRINKLPFYVPGVVFCPETVIYLDEVVSSTRATDRGRKNKMLVRLKLIKVIDFARNVKCANFSDYFYYFKALSLHFRF